MRFYVKLEFGGKIARILNKLSPRLLWGFRAWSVYDVDKQRYTHHRSTYYNACKYRDYFEKLYGGN
jgi:hypothetical protein